MSQRVSSGRIAGKVNRLGKAEMGGVAGELGANIAPSLVPGGTGKVGKFWGWITGKGVGKTTTGLAARMETEVFMKGTKMAVTRGTVIGTVAGTTIGAVTSGIRYKRTMKQLVLDYRPEVAGVLGIPEDRVNERELRRAANYLPGLKQAVKAADFQLKVAVPNAVINTGAGIAGGAAGTAIPIPGVGSVVGSIAGSMGADWALKKAESKISGITEGQTVSDMISVITAKQQSGQPVTGADVFAVKVAQDRRLGIQIKTKYGKEFDKLSPRMQLSVMMDHPELARRANAEAMAITNGARAQELIFARVYATKQGSSFHLPESQLEQISKQLLESGQVPEVGGGAPGKPSIGQWTDFVNSRPRGGRGPNLSH